MRSNIFLSNALPKRVHNDTQKNNDTKSIVISRDIVREIGTWQTAVILATEAQSGIHYAMPVRIMTGDSTTYHNQWQERQKEHRKLKDVKGDEYVSGFSKEDKIIPVTTTVLYLGEEEWDGPRCLKDMMYLKCLPQKLQDKIMKECDLSEYLTLEYMTQYWDKN